MGAARRCIIEEIGAVLGAYGIEVDPRHPGLLADYMTFEGGYRPLNRVGIGGSPSPLLQMSFETTSKFLVDAAMDSSRDTLLSPSARIVLGLPVRSGTGAFQLRGESLRLRDSKAMSLPSPPS